jgi:hypothetical protein
MDIYNCAVKCGSDVELDVREWNNIFCGKQYRGEAAFKGQICGC